jgi:uncharacterized membrane protein YgcG
MKHTRIKAAVPVAFLLSALPANAWTIVKVPGGSGGYSYLTNGPIAVSGTVERIRNGSPDDCDMIVFKASSSWNNAETAGWSTLPTHPLPVCDKATGQLSANPAAYFKTPAGDLVYTQRSQPQSIAYGSIKPITGTANACGIVKLKYKPLGLSGPNVITVNGVSSNPATMPISSKPICKGTTQYVPSDWINAGAGNGGSSGGNSGGSSGSGSGGDPGSGGGGNQGGGS